MNPVELIRELAESLNNLGGSAIEHTPHELALLTRAQTFLAAQPVVVELDAAITRNIVEIRTSAFGTPAHLALDHGNYAQGPCGVHVIVTPKT